MAVAMLRDAGRAEEVTQDIFVKIWRALPRLRRPCVTLHVAVRDRAEYLSQRGASRIVPKDLGAG